MQGYGDTLVYEVRDVFHRVALEHLTSCHGFPETPDVAHGSATHALNELLPVLVVQSREEDVWEQQEMLNFDDGLRWASQCRGHLCKRCLDRARPQLDQEVRVHPVRVPP